MVKRKPLFPLEKLISPQSQVPLILALDGIENPHNLGAMARTAAHFGVKHFLFKGEPEKFQMGAFYRVSQGGAEMINLTFCNDWSEILNLCKRTKVQTIATTPHKGEPLNQFKFLNRALLFLGTEDKGLTEEVMKQTGHLLQIPGTKDVESLNVSMATGIILYDWFLKR